MKYPRGLFLGDFNIATKETDTAFNFDDVFENGTFSEVERESYARLLNKTG